MTLIDDQELAALETEVARAFATGDASSLRVLGYGEISSVIAWPVAGGEVATKRLPPFRDDEQLVAYAACLDDYLAALAGAGIEPVTTELQTLGVNGSLIAYLVQPILPPDSLGPVRFAAAGEAEAVALFEQLLDAITTFVTEGRGLDGQLSNWVFGDQLGYLDVSTPLLRDDGGTERLDESLFMASLPWAVRPVVRRFLLQEILDKYYQPRGVVLDLLGNLYKERLDPLIPALLPRANARLSEPIEPREIERYYRGDARSWALLQRLRKLDRAWQRHVRRRAYPFLLPGPITR